MHHRFQHFFGRHHGGAVALETRETKDDGWHGSAKVDFIDASPLPWAGVTAKTAAWLRRVAADEFVAFSVNCALKFIVTEPPTPGSVRVLDREGEAAELLHLAADRTAAEAWLAAHRHPGAVLEDVTADEETMAAINGRAA